MDSAPWQAEIEAARQHWLAAVAACAQLPALRSAQVECLGKNGAVTALVRRIADVPAADKRAYGQATAALKAACEAAIAARQTELEAAEVQAELDDDTFDCTVPPGAALTGRPRPIGHLHPLCKVQQEVEAVFTSMGFAVLDYPEVESEFNNFEALNIPSWHPAREMQDTFWLDNGLLLRTHTSSGQVRALHTFKPPFRAVFAGKVFRYEATDASHEHTFHQLEGLLVDRVVSVGHLLDSMRTLLSAILRRQVEVRLRPGYFPFVEPGFELDIQCQLCGGAGCSACKHSGWLELLPCGLVHPQVLRAGGLDPAQWQGWAFGLGLSRLAMMRYGIADVRLLLGGDVRFLSQF